MRYTPFQRKMNILAKAVEDFGFEFDSKDSFDEIIVQAWDAIVNGTDGFDKIIVGSLGNHNRHLYYNDDMGYENEQDGEIISGDIKANKWMRYNEDTRSYKDIHPCAADPETDYVVCDYDLDSIGNVICIIAKMD